MDNLVVRVKRTDNRVHFECVSDTYPTITIPSDFAPPLGSGQGFAGLEILLISIASCVSTTVVFLLGRLDKHITSYTATAEGVRTERPLTLKEVRLHLSIESEDITDIDMEKVIKQAEAIAPVWQAVKNNVVVEITFELHKITENQGQQARGLVL
ncbi:MAG: OsmC family protein [Clostridia bacterium]|nr:OsmC family protein [Clostridia bacterium]